MVLSVPEAYDPWKRYPPPTLAVSEHTALRSSDFPLPRSQTSKKARKRSSDRPACLRKVMIAGLGV